MAAPKIKIRGIRTPVPSGHILGRISNGTGDAQLISIADLAYQIAATGVTGAAAPANLPVIASGDLLGNATASSAQAADTTLTALIDRAIGSTQGDILYRNATQWVVLAPDASTGVLRSGGASANPAWITLSPLIDAFLGSTQGQILYRDTAQWKALAPGVSGQFLETLGAAANPTWANVPAGVVGANPTAVASDVAVNGVATTYLRSDGAPAVQKASASQFGLVKVDGTTITAVGGVISASGAPNGMLPLVTGDLPPGLFCIGDDKGQLIGVAL